MAYDFTGFVGEFVDRLRDTEEAVQSIPNEFEDEEVPFADASLQSLEANLERFLNDVRSIRDLLREWSANG